MIAIPSLVGSLEKKASKSKLFIHVYGHCYKEVVKKEAILAKITSEDRVLNIGCGGIPYTAFQIVKQTGAKVWAVDNDPKAAEAADFCVSNMNMQDQIIIDCLDGAGKIPYPFDVAIVALQAEPKKDILYSLMNQGKAKGRLVFRKPREKVLHLYDDLPEELSPEGYTIQDKTTFGSSVLYRVHKDIEKGKSESRMNRNRR